MERSNPRTATDAKGGTRPAKRQPTGVNWVLLLNASMVPDVLTARPPRKR
jgi:hypothetical protein